VTGARCAKCRGEPSARTRRQECLDIVLVTAKGGRKKVANARPHLDGRPLSPVGGTSARLLENPSLREMKLAWVKCSEKAALRFSKTIIDSFLSFLRLSI